jgi:hypothetical protein
MRAKTGEKVSKVRVHELAKQLGMESKEVLAKLQEMGEFVRSASSTVEAPVVRKLIELYPDAQPVEEAKPVKKAAAKKAAAKKAPSKKAASESTELPDIAQIAELEGILKYQKPEDLMDLNAESTYVDTFMDYIKENGGYVNVTIVDGDKFKLQLVSKEEGERTLGQIGDMGYVCTRARWNQYAHS